MAGPRRALAANVLLSIGVTLGTLGTAELVARYTERTRPTENRAQAIEWKADFYTIKPAEADWPAGREFNRDGMRDRAHAVETPDSTRRVVFLGDSVTLGPDGHPEQAYPQIVQARLDARGPGVEVFNVSLWGWATTQERVAYQRVVRKYHPDTVVLGVCLNDIQDLQNEQARPPAWLAALHRRSALVRRVVDARGREIRGVTELFSSPDAPRVRKGLERLEAEIEGLRRDTEDDKTQLAVMVFPFRGQLAPHPPAPVVQDRLRAFCAREHLPFVDPLPALQPIGEAAFLEGDGIHFNAEGGGRVADAVLGSGIIPIPERRLAADASRAALIAALGAADADTRREAAWALGRGDGVADADIVAALRAALGDPEERVRAEAAGALGRRHAAGATADLQRALSDPRAAVRWRAAEALAGLPPPAADAVPTLATQLSSPDAHIAQFASWQLGEIGATARPALPALLEALRTSPDFGVRAVSAQTLGRVGPDDEAVLAALAAALHDDTWPEHWHAARALGHTGRRGVPLLVEALRSPDESVRLEAAQALGRLGAQAAPLGDAALAAAEHDPDPNVRNAVAKARHRIAHHIGS
jgi:HEAT repeat protein/lysophospholipase L1-like esterase